MLDKKIEEALSSGIKDTMWSMFWKGNQKANLEELENSCKRLIRMATQKNAGQRGDATCTFGKIGNVQGIRPRRIYRKMRIHP